jgi:hypothetical protein
MDCAREKKKRDKHRVHKTSYHEKSYVEGTRSHTPSSYTYTYIYIVSSSDQKYPLDATFSKIHTPGHTHTHTQKNDVCVPIDCDPLDVHARTTTERHRTYHARMPRRNTGLYMHSLFHIVIYDHYSIASYAPKHWYTANPAKVK